MNFLKTRAFPTFYQDYAPKLIEFFGAWVDWLNEEDNAAYIIDHLSSERDIDNSIDAYKTHIKDKLLVDYPESISSDLKLLLKNIFYLYNSKSSIKSYDFLFRCLFNSPANISYPKDSILRASDGRWNTPKYISVYGIDAKELGTKYNSHLIIGEISGAKAYLNGCTSYEFAKKDEEGKPIIDEEGKIVRHSQKDSILLASVDGEFISGEKLVLTNSITNEIIIDTNDIFVEFYEEGESNWIGQRGFLNSSMVLQDSYYYQDFSYVIRSNVSIHKWRNIVKNVIHPAGLEFFGDLLLSDDEDHNGVGDLEINPTEFLRNWHLLFKMYVFDTSTKINFHNWVTRVNVLAQRHSETQDAWLYYGRYHQNDGYSKIAVDTANNYFNRSSVLLFRENGTLIHPEIINWALFEFTEDIDDKIYRSNVIHGVTLDPQSHIIYGNINGNSWKPEIEESFISNNFMMFVTDTSHNQNNLVKSFVVGNEYLRYDENPEGEDFLIQDTKLSYEAKKFPSEIKTWEKLTVKDYIETSKETDKLYDDKSLLKIPDDFVSTIENKYTIKNRSYNNERVVVYSYSPEDFTHRIFINRENNKVNLHYTSYNWYKTPNPETPIIDTNLRIMDTSVSNSATSNTDIYKCESFSYDNEGNEYNLQQTQFSIQLPYAVDKENILLFTDGKYSKNFKLKNNNIITIDTEDNEQKIICYIQDNGSITSDKNGTQFLYFLVEKTILFNKNSYYFIQDNGNITTDYIGLNVIYKVNTTDSINDYKEIIIDNTTLYWHTNGKITSDKNGTNLVFETKTCGVIVDKDVVKYFIQSNNTVTSDAFGDKLCYYVQPDNTITTHYILYDSSNTEFKECTLQTTLSKSETNNTKLEDFILLDEIVIELNNAVTKEFGDLTLNEVVFYIYGLEQTRMSSTAELYLLSPRNAMRQETTPYTQDMMFTYNSAVLSPFGLYNTQINHFHIANYKDLYDMDIESHNWLRRWYKVFMTETTMSKRHKISLSIAAQNHSETMDDVFARNLIEMYNLRFFSDEEKQTSLNKNSLLVFGEDGRLIDKNRIDWFNMTVEGSNVLYSLQLMSENVYEKGVLPKNDNYFLFLDGKKVLDADKSKNALNKNAQAYDYNKDFIAEYYTGSTDNIVSLKYNGSTNTENDILANATQDTTIILKNGNAEYLKNIPFTEVIEKQLYVMTGEDYITIKTKLYNVNTDYILVFVDGRYTRNWEYKTNGSVVLKDTPQTSYEVYILKPLDYNSQDMTVRGTGDSFSFNNMRLNPYAKAAGHRLIDTKMFASNADIQFISKQIKKLAIFKQSMNFWKTFLRGNKNTTNPTIMLHFTMDKLLQDGSFDVYPYSNSKPRIEVKTPTRYICNVDDGSIVYYIQNNNTITTDIEGESIHYYLIDDAIYSDSDGTNIVFRINGYEILSAEENNIVYKLKLIGKQYIETPTRYICDIDDRSIVLYIQNNNTITTDIYGENIVYYITDDAIYSDVNTTELVYNIQNDTILSLDGELAYYIVYDGKPINTLENKFNRHATMLFDNNGLLINPYSINWGETEFLVPQITNRLTAVCLNGGYPALVGDLIKTNQNQLLTAQASILDDISISKLSMSAIEHLDITEEVLRNPYTYDTDLLETVGITDYIYQKISDEAYETLYSNAEEFIPENVFAFVNGKKVYKDDIEINIEKSCYVIHNEDKYTNSRTKIAKLGDLTENDFIMLMEYDINPISDIEGDSNVLFVEDEILIDKLENFTEKTDIIQNVINSKECIVFQYNPEDLDSIIEEKHPSSRFFNLPEVGYTKDNILAFKNGVHTTDYYIFGDKIAFKEEDVIDTIEIYVFKKYDYLFIDENKYNKNCYDFTIKNIKRSIFF